MNLIEFLKKQNIIPGKKAEKFIEILEQYSENDVLYPDIIKELDLTGTEHERLFNEMEKRDYVATIYIIQCPYCNELGNSYVDEDDIPFIDHCRFCEAEFNHQENHMHAYRLFFNYDEEVDVIEELNDKISSNQDRIMEITDEIRSLENARKTLQLENINFITSKNELIKNKNESKAYSKMIARGSNVRFLGRYLDNKKLSLKCFLCGDDMEFFDVNGKIMGACPGCDCEVEMDFQ
ncbi:MAG: hypothetical protein PHC44_10555 [Lutispora sp.]|nr:hypothetical protein [Lutispora sp.]MDD4835147.1 hypothetical protein [Lutispora sp.]